MGYFEQSELSNDPDFAARVAACAAVELDLGAVHPVNWTAANVWEIAAAPGFADAYSSAIAGGVPNPGRDPAVISDDQIRAAVVALTPDDG